MQYPCAAEHLSKLKEIMKQEDIKKLFPLTATISSEMDLNKSIGTQLLLSKLPKELHDEFFWGLSIGNVKGVLIKTEEIVEWEGKTLAVPFYLQKDRVSYGMDIVFKLRKLNE